MTSPQLKKAISFLRQTAFSKSDESPLDLKISQNKNLTENSKLYIPSADLAECTINFLKNIIETANYSVLSLNEIYKTVKNGAEILVQAALVIIDDESGISKSIIYNATLRVLKMIKDQEERLEHGIDEGSYEDDYNRNIENYKVFFGDAIKKVGNADKNKNKNLLTKNGSSSTITSSGTSNSENTESCCASDIDDDILENDAMTTSTRSMVLSLSKQEFEIVKKQILDDVYYLIEELANIVEEIEINAMNQIEAGDTILTVGYCNTMSAIFRKASEKYRDDQMIHVVVAQGPKNNGEIMAKKLKNLPNIRVSFITDSSIYVALQQGVNKVMLGAKLILGDGSCIVASGTHTFAAICAKTRHIPVMVCAGTHKFSGIFHGDVSISHGNVSKTLKQIKLEYKSHNLVKINYPDVQDIIDPKTDLIAAENIDLILINDVAHTPGFVYRKLYEMYPLEEIHIS